MTGFLPSCLPWLAEGMLLLRVGWNGPTKRMLLHKELSVHPGSKQSIEHQNRKAVRRQCTDQSKTNKTRCHPHTQGNGLSGTLAINMKNWVTDRSQKFIVHQLSCPILPSESSLGDFSILLQISGSSKFESQDQSHLVTSACAQLSDWRQKTTLKTRRCNSRHRESHSWLHRYTPCPRSQLRYNLRPATHNKRSVHCGLRWFHALFCLNRLPENMQKRHSPCSNWWLQCSSPFSVLWVLFESCEGHGKGNLNTSFETLPSQHPSCTRDHSCWQ